MPLHLLLPVVLIAAKLAGQVVRRLGLPALVGEIATGIALGPVALAVIPAEGQQPARFELLQEIAHIGLCALLFQIGLEAEPARLRAIWRPSARVAVASGVLTFGFVAGVLAGWPRAAALFAAAALSATSLSATACVLAELRLHNSREGNLALAVALMTNLVALVVASLLTTAGAAAGIVALGAAVFLVASIVLGPYVARVAVQVAAWCESRAMLLVLAFSVLLLFGFAAHAAGLAWAIGAYVAGLSFGRCPQRERLVEDLRPIIELLTPLFFVFVGATIEFSGLRQIGYVSALVLAAGTGKLLAPFAAGEHEGLNRRLTGSALVASGGMGMVVAQVGRTAGAFTTEQFSIVELAVVGTTVLGAALIRWAGRRISGGAAYYSTK